MCPEGAALLEMCRRIPAHLHPQTPSHFNNKQLLPGTSYDT